jgi:hypothetical protein
MGQVVDFYAAAWPNFTPALTGRATLGLGTMATQAANNVSITGGTIDSVTLDGGTF